MKYKLNILGLAVLALLGVAVGTLWIAPAVTSMTHAQGGLPLFPPPPTIVPTALPPLATMPPPTPEPTETPLPSRPVGLDSFYVVDPNALSITNPSQSSIFALAPETGEARARFVTRYLPSAAISPEGRFLYVMDSSLTPGSQGSWDHFLTAFDTQTRQVIWQITLPRGREFYQGYPYQQEVWTSPDGRWLYMRLSAYRLLKVDTTTHQIVREINSGWACNLAMKLTLVDTLFTICDGQFQTLDLTSLQRGEVLPLPGFQVLSPLIVKDQPLVANVNAVSEATQVNQLYVVTSRSDVITINFRGRPKAQSVHLDVPSGWELAAREPFAITPDGRILYIGASPAGSSALDQGVVEEVWAYATTTGQRVGTVRPTHGAFNFAVSVNGRWLYTVNPHKRTLSIIETATLREVKVIENLGRSPAWIIPR